MKNTPYPFVLLASFCILSASVSAQKNTLSFTPLPLTGKLGLQYERKISPWQTLSLEWQHWESSKRNNSGFAFFGFISSSSNVTTISGNRLHLTGRLYAKKGAKGWFVEGGMYAGKFDVVQKESSSSWSVWGFLEGDFFGSESHKVTRFDNVKSHGFKLGGGYRWQKKSFLIDYSAGFELSNTRADVVKIAPRLRTGAPYARIQMGFQF